MFGNRVKTRSSPGLGQGGLEVKNCAEEWDTVPSVTSQGAVELVHCHVR